MALQDTERRKTVRRRKRTSGIGLKGDAVARTNARQRKRKEPKGQRKILKSGETPGTPEKRGAGEGKPLKRKKR